MGRLAEAEGEAAIYQDLRMKLFIDPDAAEGAVRESPPGCKALMNALADGLNYYLVDAPGGEAARHHALRAVDGADASPKAASAATSKGQSRRSSRRSTAVHRRRAGARGGGPDARADYVEPSGSNGIAIAPSNTAGHHALLLINPHTSFFFRSELQMTSDEGLNAYGAVTWGQFFVYQGFNDRAGWMHTSSGVDDVDEYLETVTKKGDGFVYATASEERPVTSSTITCRTRRRAAWQTKSSPSTGRSTARSSARRTASGSASR